MVFMTLRLPCQQSFVESVNELMMLEMVHVKLTLEIGMPTTLNIPISEGGIHSSHTHNLAKSQSYQGLKLLLTDTSFLTTEIVMLIYHRFHENSCVPHGYQ